MKIKNLHQPYIFKRDGRINFIVSEFLPNKLVFKWGERFVEESYWKLYHLDSEYNKTVIKTPSELVHEGITYHVIQECNGFLYGDFISYIIGGHTKKDQDRPHFFLVQGNFDFNSKKVENIFIKDYVRTGFLNDKKMIADVVTKKILENNLELFDCSTYFDELIRIIPIFGQNKVLITGFVNENFKTLVLDLSTKNLQILESVENKHIYKSSIFDDGKDKLIAFTEKSFNGESDPDYVLNIENDYLLKEL